MVTQASALPRPAALQEMLGAWILAVLVGLTLLCL